MTEGHETPPAGSTPPGPPPPPAGSPPPSPPATPSPLPGSVPSLPPGRFPPPPMLEPVVEEARGTAWLSYLFILWLVPMIAFPDNPFAKFHVKQGIILTLYGVAITIVIPIPILGWFLIAPLSVLLYTVLGIVAIIGIVQALNGKYWRAPFGIATLAEKWFKF